jgi:hypothetical protein
MATEFTFILGLELILTEATAEFVHPEAEDPITV